MRGYRHGLLVGKFYPPHVGHHRVIRLGAARCERFTVLVMAAMVETVPLADRVAWLRAEHADDSRIEVVGIRCDAPVDVDDPAVWDAQLAAMRAALATRSGPPVDVVVAADAYGDELALRLGATWLPVDRPTGEPSGTQVRRDLAAGWDLLAPATRAGLAARVVVLGAESTGTTTVAERLAAHYRALGGVWARTAWVAEYGRAYSELKWQAARAATPAGAREPALDELVWTHGDFDAVAAEQTRTEQAAAADGSPLLVCDTDAFATAVWERRYLGDQARLDPPYAQELPRHDLYLLTDHEGVPWHDDGLREGDLTVRAAMTGWFGAALTAAGHSWVLLTGDEDTRVRLAVRTVDQLLAYRMCFGEPLHGPGFMPSR
jgi:HTH-type transcriptional regulator, transcriptional repressor of NAD biosynthesis genes